MQHPQKTFSSFRLNALNNYLVVMRWWGEASFPHYWRRLLLRLPSPPAATGAGGTGLCTWVADSSYASRGMLCAGPVQNTLLLITLLKKHTLKADSSHQNIKNSINAMLWSLGHKFFPLQMWHSYWPPGCTQEHQGYQQVPETKRGSFFSLSSTLWRCSWEWSYESKNLEPQLI